MLTIATHINGNFDTTHHNVDDRRAREIVRNVAHGYVSMWCAEPSHVVTDDSMKYEILEAIDDVIKYWCAQPGESYIVTG
jgi:hypothetical protein